MSDLELCHEWQELKSACKHIEKVFDNLSDVWDWLDECVREDEPMREYVDRLKELSEVSGYMMIDLKEIIEYMKSNWK
jgi:hypothetical protein